MTGLRLEVCICLTVDYEQSLSFFCSPSSKTGETQMATRVTDGARWERLEKREKKREKPAHTPDTLHVQPLSCKLQWTNQKHFYCFLLKPIRDNLAPGFPRALDVSPLHAQKSSGSRLLPTKTSKLRLSCRKKENLKRWKVLEVSKLTYRLRNHRFQTAKGKSARHH